MYKLRKVTAMLLTVCMCAAMTLTAYADESYDDAPISDGIIGEELATASDATESDAIEAQGIAPLAEVTIDPLAFNLSYPDPYLGYYHDMNYYITNIGSREHWVDTVNKSFEIDTLDSDLQDVIAYYNIDRNQDGIMDFSELDYLTTLARLYSGWPASEFDDLQVHGGDSAPLASLTFPIWSWIEDKKKTNINDIDDKKQGGAPLDISGMIYEMNGGSYAESNPVSYDSNDDGLVDSFRLPVGNIDDDDNTLINNYKKMVDNQTYFYSLTSLERGTLANGNLSITALMAVKVESVDNSGAVPEYDSATKTIKLHIPDYDPSNPTSLDDYYYNNPIAYYNYKKIIIPNSTPLENGPFNTGFIGTPPYASGYVVQFSNDYTFGEYGGMGNKVVIKGYYTHPIKVVFKAGTIDYNKRTTIVEATYNQTHKFVSGTADKELPSAIVTRTPSKVKGLADGTTVTPGTFDKTDYSVSDGVWKWQSWDHESLTIDSADVEFIGTWVFTSKTTPSNSNPGGGSSGGGGSTPTPKPVNPTVTPDPVPPTEIPANPVPDRLTDQQWRELVARTQDPNDPLYGMDPLQVALSNMYLNNGMPKTGEDPSYAWIYLLISLSLLSAGYGVTKKVKF